MYEIEMNKMSDAFMPCWIAAGNHLNNHMDKGNKAWLRAHPYPPFLEHLSFRLGNQLFFVRIEDVDGKIQGPGPKQGHITAASLANGRACIMPMKKTIGGEWRTVIPGWGLLDAENNKAFDPVELITDKNIEMTPWEIHDMAVQIIRDYLKNEGFELMSWVGNPEIDPSIWFIGKSGRPEWVVVRTVKFPEMNASRPKDWNSIAEACAKLSTNGHFASIAIVSMDQQFASNDEPAIPLWRGHGMHVRFTGLE
jgi:hypothetical protein